jgi:hypothetical protein
MYMTEGDPKTAAAVSAPAHLNLIVQAHVADYQAIATRISRFMSLQFVPWPGLAVFLTLVATTHRLFDPVLVAWGTAGIAQIAVITYYYALYEVYNHVRYVETVLKPNLARLLCVHSDAFWGYERYLANTGKANDPLLGDIGPAVVSFLATALAAIARIPGSGWDYLGSILNGVLLVVTVTSVIRVVKVRKGFTRVA